MRFQPGILICLLAGCAVQPTLVEARAAHGAARAAATGSDAATGAAMRTLAHGDPLRIGVEFLPPAAAETAVAVPPAAARAEAVPEALAGRSPGLPRKRELYGGRDRGERHTWTMNTDDLAAIRDPAALETLRFLDDVMGEDRRRLKWELGTPILTMQTIDLQSPAIDLQAEEAQAEEEAEWLGQHGAVLLKRPVQHLLRRLPLIQAFEVEIDEFKSDNVPLTQAYWLAHAEEGNFGRVSLRVHAGDLHDPVEIVYMESGVRVGTSQQRLKLGYACEVADNVMLELRTRRDYDGSQWHLRADLSWLLSARTSLHFVAGDDLDFLATSTVYSLFDSPMDGSPGLLLYAVHLF